MRVGLFVTCLVDLMRPEIGFSVIKLLEHAGFDVHVPAAQTCCGQPAYNSGERRIARELAEKVLREKQVERRLRPWTERAALTVWGFVAMRPALYALLTRAGVRILERLGGSGRRISKLSFGGGWTDTRDMPAPVGRTFRELYQARQNHG
nr:MULTISPECIES: heterodisulfide reductase-related iron-sulfur binding cluster [Mycetohabitans]